MQDKCVRLGLRSDIGQTVIFRELRFTKYKALAINTEDNPSSSIPLTEVAGEGGPHLAPQKFLLSQQFRYLMRCKKYLKKIFYLA